MNHELSVTEAAKILGISRTAVLKAITNGRIPARKIGNVYVLKYSDLNIPSDSHLSKDQEKFIETSVDKVLEEYGETLRMLKDA